VKLTVVAVGKIREKSLRAVADDYLGRVKHYARASEIEVKTDAELARAVPREATVIALDPGGDSVTSRELARRLEGWGQRGKGELAFVIGGAEGIPEALLEAAHARLQPVEPDAAAPARARRAVRAALPRVHDPARRAVRARGLSSRSPLRSAARAASPKIQATMHREP
jgi:23S rRNA (pseudouridine1915-N3)-methyltransferase